MGHREHRHEGPRAVPCAVLTVSDTRDETTDGSGRFIRRRLARAGHPVVDYRVLRDDPAAIRRHVRNLARRRSPALGALEVDASYRDRFLQMVHGPRG